MMLLQRK